MKKIFSLFAAVLFAGSMMAADAIMAAGTNGYDDFTVNGKPAVKIGTSSKGGDMSVTVGAGATSLTVYAAAWKGVSSLSLNITAPEGVTITPASISLAAEENFTGSEKAFTVADESAYKFAFVITGADAGATFTFTTSIAKRFLMWSATYETAGETPVEPTPTELQAVSDSTTWDFSKITANTANALYGNDGIKLTDESTPSKNDEVIYADYSEDFMTIGEEFNKAAIAFKGEYPIRKNQYCQAGTLHFKADVAGTIVVKFSDTGSSASATAVKRYLVVNGEQTEYWTSRENNGEAPYDAQLNVVSGKIEVPAGDVTITGSSAIVMYYVTFVPEEHVYTCAQVQANEATAEGVLNEVTVMFVNGSNVFVKDETGMTQVYLKSNGLAIGDKVSGIKGASTLYKSTPEFVPTNAPADWTVVAGETPVYDEKETIATTADVNGVYVFKNVTFAEATEFTTAEQVNATVTIGEESIVLRNNYKFAYSFTANKAYDVKAVVVIYNNAAQLYFISAEKHISTAISNTAVEGKAVKTITNGMLIIEKNGVKYNVMGQAIR
ncbi:MAG: hypothetical protein IJQ32_05275 [Paludibacteraceae bacterium]|nr:hypothetical protein [Paludibacteraceae bacterium]